MRVIFMGTPDFAVPSLQGLVEADYPVVLVVTQPDRPKGRGKKMAYSPVKEYALSRAIPLLQPESARGAEFLAQLKEYQPEVMVVVAYGQILPPTVLDLPKYGCVNVHASLLPQYRGAAPIHRALLNGEEVTGVTTMYLDQGLDTGDMILKKEIPIGAEETVGELHDRLATAGAALLVETMDLIAQGKAPRTPQVGETSYAAKLTSQDELIDWQRSAREIYNQIRGLNPWPVARTYLGAKVVKVWCGAVDQETRAAGSPGQILDATEEGLRIATGQGTILITELQMQGAKRMAIADFLRGHEAPLGAVFTAAPASATGGVSS